MVKIDGKSCPRYQVIQKLQKASSLYWFSFLKVRHDCAKSLRLLHRIKIIAI